MKIDLIMQRSKETKKTSDYLENFIGHRVLVTMTVSVSVFPLGLYGEGTFLGVTTNGNAYVFWIGKRHYIVPCKDCVIEFKDQ